jgi:hypothetical protein
MKLLHIFLWITILLSVTIAVAGAADIDGFRGIKWGTDFSTLNAKEFTKLYPFRGIAPEMESYQRINENLDVAGMRVENINYNFYKGKFVSVNIDYKGFFVYEKFADYCKEMFGQATSSMIRNMEYTMSYESTRTGALLYLLLTTPIYSEGRLFFYSRNYIN